MLQVMQARLQIRQQVILIEPDQVRQVMLIEARPGLVLSPRLRISVNPSL
jgi:hypothetical protein